MSQPTTFIPTPQAEAKRQQEVSDRSEVLALDILRAAIQAHAGQVSSAGEIASTAETFWQWVTSDIWPPAVKNNQ